MTLTEKQTAELGAPLDKARVKQRDGSGRAALSYLETHDVIRRANDIFGFGYWGHEVVQLRQLNGVVVHNREQKAGYAVGYICTVKLTVAGCVPVSGIGYGDATEYRESAAVTAHELAAKEAESDALKRAFKNFGDQFGLALYDKDAENSGHLASAQRSTEAASAPPGASSRAEGGAPPTQGAPPASSDAITEPQRKRLWAIAKEEGVDVDTLKALVRTVAGVESANDIPRGKYDELVEAVKAASIPF